MPKQNSVLKFATVLSDDHIIFYHYLLNTYAYYAYSIDIYIHDSGQGRFLD